VSTSVRADIGPWGGAGLDFLSAVYEALGSVEEIPMRDGMHETGVHATMTRILSVAKWKQGA
jgi:hypothetical protein